ncbi:STAS domain-containing protein [Azospirillum sp. sgz302134]
MQIEEETHGGVTVLRAAGRIDSASARAFEARLVAAVEPGPIKLVLDLGGVTLLTSAGLRSLLKAAKRAKPAGSRIVLAAIPAPVRGVFDASGFSSLFESHATTDAAVAALSR